MKYLVLITALLLTGCASVGERVAQCEQETGASPDACLASVQAQDAQLAQGLQQLNNQYMQQQLQEQQAPVYYAPAPTFPTHTNCQRFGDTVNCTTM